MPIFNNTKILKSGSDITLGAVYVDNDKFNLNKFQDLIHEKIEDLIDFYVDDRIRNSSKRDELEKEHVLSDLAMMISEKLHVPVDNIDTTSLVIAIKMSDSYNRFMGNMKEGFSFYENTIAATPNAIPVLDESLNLTDKQKEFFSQDSIESVYNETNLIDFIETLSKYGITELY